jgi:hypothetical protein
LLVCKKKVKEWNETLQQQLQLRNLIFWVLKYVLNKNITKKRMTEINFLI